MVSAADWDIRLVELERQIGTEDIIVYNCRGSGTVIVL